MKYERQKKLTGRILEAQKNAKDEYPEENICANCKNWTANIFGRCKRHNFQINLLGGCTNLFERG